MTLLKLRLAASAFVPAAAIAAIRLWGVGGTFVWSLMSIAFAVVATVSLVLLLGARSDTNAQPHTIRQSTDESGEVPAFLLAYVFPFVFLTVTDVRDALAYLVFAMFLVVLVLRTNLWQINPLLLLVGLHIYSVETHTGFAGILFSRSRPRVGQNVNAVMLSPGAHKATS
jgi:hypothetical protein